MFICLGNNASGSEQRSRSSGSSVLLSTKACACEAVAQEPIVSSFGHSLCMCS